MQTSVDPAPVLNYGTPRTPSRACLWSFITSLLLLGATIPGATLAGGLQARLSFLAEWGVFLVPIAYTACLAWCIALCVYVDRSQYSGRGFAVAGAWLSGILLVLYVLFTALLVAGLQGLGGV